MGIDLHGINFIRFAAKSRPLGRVATIGRQGLYLPKDKLATIAGNGEDYGDFCERFLVERMGATSVESFDYSGFEGATHIHDLNKPLTGEFAYDTVIDAGTSEHVFDVAQALKTISQICAPNGQILHMVPANNMCGHGFWQFSPGLFFALYSPQNGYGETRVFLTDYADDDHWFETLPSKSPRGQDYLSASSLNVMARTVKCGASFTHDDVQQIEYQLEWSAPAKRETRSSLRHRVKSALAGTPAFKPVRALYRVFSRPDIRNCPNVTRWPVGSMLESWPEKF